MVDGSITFSTALDNKELEKQLAGLIKKITTLENRIGQKQAVKLPLVEQSKQLSAQLDVASAKLHEMQSASKGTFASEQIKEQKVHVSGLQSEWNRVQGKVESYDTSINNSTIELNRTREAAGGVARQLSAANGASDMMGKAVRRASKNLDVFRSRLAAVVRSALVFTVITQALAKLRNWMGKVVSANTDASAAIARLKGSLLTLAQPLVDTVIPAFTAFIDVLTGVVDQIAKATAAMFGMSIEASRAAAAALYEQTEALDDTGTAAKKASKQLAAFDEINKIGADEKQDDKKANANFDGASSGNWLKDRLGEAAGMVTAALLLGGIALIALGAGTGNVVAVLAGLLLIGSSVNIGEKTGVIQSWVDTLGLNTVSEFVVLAIILGGIAIIALGAAMGNIFMVLAGLALVGTAIAYAQKSGMASDWASTLGLSKAATYITAALLIGGIALVAIGAMTVNIIMIIAGLILLGAGVYIGGKSEVLKSWWDALMLSDAAAYVTAALLIGGIALVAVGAMTANIVMVLAGLALLGAGVAVGLASGTFQSWADALQLPAVAGWITAALLLGGIALLAIGAMTANHLMVIGGLALLGAGVAHGVEKGTFSAWWETLMLPEVAGWLTPALLLGGIALLAIGVMMGNLIMIAGGLLLLGVGVAVGAQSGALQKWWDTLMLPEVAGWVETALLLGGIALIAIGAATGNIALLLVGLGLLGAGVAIGAKSRSIHGMPGGASGASQPYTMQSMPSMPPIPHLAKGAVIPPNREFLAVLGDQRSGTNVEAPVSVIEEAVERAVSRNGGGGTREIHMYLHTGPGLARELKFTIDEETRRQGIKLTQGV